MAGFVPFGLNLQLQSGVPLVKVASVYLEKLTATKRLDGGGGGTGMQKIMQQVMQSGCLQGVMKNPMAALTGGIQGQIPGLVGQLQGMIGGAPQGLIGALSGSTGLGQIMGQLQAAGDNLAGLTNGAQGFFQMIGHATTVDLAGAALPPLAAMSVVQAPINSGAFLNGIATALPDVVARVVANTMTAADAQAWVQAQIAAAQSIIDNSAAALAWGEAMHPILATVSSVAGAVAVPSHMSVSPFQAVLGTLVQPEAHAAFDAAMADQMSAPAPAKPSGIATGLIAKAQALLAQLRKAA